MKRFFILIALLLCTSQARATLSIIQNTKIAAVTCGTTTGTACTLTVPSSQSGGNSMFVLLAFNSAENANYISTTKVPTCSGCGTWVVPTTGCEGTYTYGAISCAYLLASPSTSISSVVVVCNNSGTYYFYWFEIAFTKSQVLLDGNPASSIGTSGTSIAMQSLTTTGTSEVIIEAIETACCTVTYSAPSPYNTYFLQGANTYGAATAAITTSTSYSWGVSPAHTSDLLGIAFYESNPTCGTPVFGTIPKMYDASLPQTTTITSGCTYDCYAFNGAPASASPPACSAGTRISDGGTVTLPVGTNTLEALGTDTNYNPSPVQTGSYNIQRTASAFNGITVGNVSGNVNAINGNPLGNAIPGSGTSGAWDSLATPLPFVASMFLDSHAGTNGVAPTYITLGNSAYWASGEGSHATWTTASPGAGTIYSNVPPVGNLLQPVYVAGTVYNATGTLGLLCNTSASVPASTYCAIPYVSVNNAGPSTSLGFWVLPNCPANQAVDCGAQSGLWSSSGGDVVVHFNPGPGGNNPCNYNGIMFEMSGGNEATSCFSYTNNVLYRINLQANQSSGTVTATFSNGSAVISATQSFGVNEAVQLSTTGTLPTNFATSTTYYVLSTGLSGSAFELAASQGGTAIVAGSAGTGAQTVTVIGQLTVCNANGTLLGNTTGTAATSGVVFDTVIFMIVGEGPEVAGDSFWYGGYVLDLTGKFSATSCIL